MISTAAVGRGEMIAKTGFARRLIGVAVFLFALAATGVGQVTTEAWVARYNGPGNYNDGASALAVDGAGNVYITGYSSRGGTGYDYATIKYDSNGNQLWVARYNGPVSGHDTAEALAIDAAGNVYVTGYSYGAGTDYDYATIKYDTNGNQLWVARYNGPGNYDDRSRALAVDAAGNVYVTGNSYSTGTYYDYATIKYDSNGNQLWVAYGYDFAKALAVDAAGNVYVTGWSRDAGNGYHDYATIKYDSNGNQLWVARYNGPGNYHDDAYALAVDAAGNVYVTGYSNGVGNNVDYATIKYGSSGNQLWVARYNGPGNGDDTAEALAIDAAGNVYVTGQSYGAGTNFDYATIKYDSNGNQLWVARYNGPGGHQDIAKALAVDASGNVYVTGKSIGAGNYHYATVKYDSNGNQLWVARYNGLVNGSDLAYALAVDAAGNVYVTGESYGGATSDYDYATIKYVQNAVLPQTLDIFRGRLIFGGLQQLLQSDDQRLVVAPGPVFTNSQSPIHIIIEGTAPSGNLSELRFALEGQTTSTNVEQRIELYNFLTSAYETVDLRPSTTSDSLAEVSITNNPQRFIQSGTRLMRTRMRYKANGPIFTYPWQARLDHTYWTIFP